MAMATATQTQVPKAVKHNQLHHRRTKERVDALENQFLRLPETRFRQQEIRISLQVASTNVFDSAIQEAARIFAKMDKIIFGYLVEASKRLDHEEFGLQSMAQYQGYSAVSDWRKYLEREVKAMNLLSTHGFEHPEAFLKEPSSGMYWAEAEAIFSQSMDRARYAPKTELATFGEQLVDDLTVDSNKYSMLIASLLPELAELNQFDSEMQGVLRRKWTFIDSILDRWFKEARKSTMPRWQALSQMFKHRATNEEDHLPAQLNHISSALWLSLLVFVITIPTTALGWRYSPHQPGTTQDADFWFLIQSSWMTILGFAVLAIPIWRTKTFSAKARFWVWGLLITASLCVVLSPLVYVFGPTEWSQFMSIVSGIVQVFLTLQIALVADSAGQRGEKSGKKAK